MAKNISKIAEVKLSSGGFKVVDFRKNCECGIAVAEQHFLKSCGIAIVEVLPSTCGIAIADSKTKLLVPTSVGINSGISIQISRFPGFLYFGALSASAVMSPMLQMILLERSNIATRN
jgi:hypothetical protein